MFGEKWDLTCLFTDQIVFFEKTPISMLTVYLQRSVIMSFGSTGPYVFEKTCSDFGGECVYFVRRGYLSFELPIVEIWWAG